MSVLDKEKMSEELILQFNGPEDEEDFLDDDFELEELESSGGIEDFDDDDF